MRENACDPAGLGLARPKLAFVGWATWLCFKRLVAFGRALFRRSQPGIGRRPEPQGVTGRCNSKAQARSGSRQLTLASKQPAPAGTKRPLPQPQPGRCVELRPGDPLDVTSHGSSCWQLLENVSNPATAPRHQCAEGDAVRLRIQPCKPFV